MRFLRLERRLRGILTQIVATNPDMEAFLAAVEAVLRAFAQVGGWGVWCLVFLCVRRPAVQPKHKPIPKPQHHHQQGEPLPATTDGTDDDSAASSDAPLARALVGPIRIDSSAPSSSSSSSSKRPTTTTLVLPLRGSAFLRLLVHGCAQFYGLKSRSEDLAAPHEACRAVLVTRPSSSSSPSSAALLGAGGGSNLGMTMRAFIRHSRLEQGRLKPGCKGRRLGGGGGELEGQEGGAAAEGGEP